MIINMYLHCCSSTYPEIRSNDDGQAGRLHPRGRTTQPVRTYLLRVQVAQWNGTPRGVWIYWSVVEDILAFSIMITFNNVFIILFLLQSPLLIICYLWSIVSIKSKLWFWMSFDLKAFFSIRFQVRLLLCIQPKSKAKAICPKARDQSGKASYGKENWGSANQKQEWIKDQW